MMEYSEFKKKLKDKKTIIVLDTNVILDLARYSLYTSKNIMMIFDKCSDLIWIPNQVINEYNKNKYVVFGDLKKRYSNFENRLKIIIDKSENSVKKELKTSERYNYPFIKEYFDKILKKFKEVREEIETYKDIVGEEYKVISLRSNELEHDIEKFVSNLGDKNQIGCKIGFKEELEIIREGELRYKYELPPGFKDNGKEGIEKFGDLFLWKEILKLPSIKEVNSIIFITNDEKDDWWEKEKSKKNKEAEETGILINLRSELQEEFSEINPRVSIDFMTITMFQGYASKLYNLLESQVYIDLNRDDDAFIKRVNKKIEEDIQNFLCLNSECYLGFGIVVDCVQDCEFIGKKNVNSYVSNGGIFINYELEYQLELYCYTDDDLDEDSYDDVYVYFVTVVISIDRFIENLDLENLKKNPKYLREDEEYVDFHIIDFKISDVI